MGPITALTNLCYLRSANPVELVYWRDQPRIGERTVTFLQARFLWDLPNTTQRLAPTHRNEFSVPNYQPMKG